MPLVRVLYQNHGLEGTWTASSQVATLPATHLANTARQRVWRSTGISAEWVKVDLGAAQAIDGVALISPNFTVNAEIMIEANTSDSFPPGGGGFKTAARAWLAPNTKVLVKFFDMTRTFRWWRIVLRDTGNSDGYLQLGVVVLSPALVFSSPADRIRYALVDPSFVEYAPAGTPKTYELAPYAMVRLPFRALPESLVFGTLRTALREMGRKKDGVLCLDHEAPSGSNLIVDTNLYGRLVELSSFDEKAWPSWYEWDFTFRESL